MSTALKPAIPPKPHTPSRALRSVLKNYELYLFLLPAVALTFCFSYIPMYGVQIAFKRYSPALGIWGSPWVGFEQFLRFFRSYQFGQVISNTLILSAYGIAANFPIPIALALMLNQMRSQRFKRAVQTVTYLPYFISTVVLVSMVLAFLSPSTGLYGAAVRALGGEPEVILGKAALFPHIYVWSGVWQGTGWGSIIYLAALSAVDPELYEAATIDGANRWRKVLHIDIPSILNTCVIMLILSAGGILSVGFEKAFLMQNPLNLSASEVISTYVYKVGIVNTQYSFSSAIGLFNTAVNFVILAAVNGVSRKLGDTSLW